MPYLSHHVATVCTALLFLALSLVQGGCSPARHASPAEGALSLTILHTNDTHSHIAGINKYGNACFDDTDCRGGLARIATAIRTAKSQNDNVIALDAGDQCQGTLFYSVNKWPMLAELDQHMPYDAMTLGNHEFDEGCLELTRFLAALPFPVLAANLKPAKGCPMLKGNYTPYTLLTVRGQKVAVVGIANNEVVSLAAACPRTFFEDTAACLQRTVRDLEAQGVKHIIALTHIGLPEDRKLARSVDGVDIIVGGHSHSYLGPDSEGVPLSDGAACARLLVRHQPGLLLQAYRRPSAVQLPCLVEVTLLQVLAALHRPSQVGVDPIFAPYLAAFDRIPKDIQVDVFVFA